MHSVFTITRLKLNKNLGTIDKFRPEVHIDIEADEPIRWETYQWKPPKEKRYIFTKIYFSSGSSIITEMTIEEWENHYSKFLEAYDTIINNKNPDPIEPN